MELNVWFILVTMLSQTFCNSCLAFHHLKKFLIRYSIKNTTSCHFFLKINKTKNGSMCTSSSGFPWLKKMGCYITVHALICLESTCRLYNPQDSWYLFFFMHTCFFIFCSSSLRIFSVTSYPYIFYFPKRSTYGYLPFISLFCSNMTIPRQRSWMTL